MPAEPHRSEPAPAAEPPVTDTPSVRDRVYRNGRMLVARQLSGTVVRVLGMLAVTRLIGPLAFGLYSGAAAVAAVLATLAGFGTDVHLVRSKPRDRRAEDTVFTLLLGSSLLMAAVGFVVAPLFGSWIGDGGAVGPTRAVTALLPLMVLVVPARARLERELAFGPVAVIELTADIMVYAVAIPLALAGAGVWAPVGGLAARHVVLLLGISTAARYRPRPAWDRNEARAALRFGRGYSAGKWVSVTGQLVNPILVGGVLGPVGVGHVAVASRIVEQLGAVKQATMRLATAALARFQDDHQRLRAAHAEGMLAQVFGSVPLYAAAAFTAPWLLPRLFGEDWLPAVELLSLLALAASIGTLFNLHATTLRVVGRNGPVARLRVLQVCSFAVTTSLVVPVLGVSGFGVARLVRAVPFVLAHRDLSELFTPSYRSGVRWLAALAPMMASPWLPPLWRPILLLPLAAVLAIPSARAELLLMVRRAGGIEGGRFSLRPSPG